MRGNFELTNFELTAACALWEIRLNTGRILSAGILAAHQPLLVPRVGMVSKLDSVYADRRKQASVLSMPMPALHSKACVSPEPAIAWIQLGVRRS